MGRSFKNISEGLRLIPRDGSVVGNLGGDFEVLTEDGKAYFYNASQSSSSPLVTENHSATLTSKVIDADDNTISNLTNANIKSDANIDRTKLADGTANAVLVNDGDGVMSSITALDVPRGGTGAATLTGYVKGNSTSAFTASSTVPRADIANGTANHVVINNGSGALSSEAQLDETRGGTGIGTYATGDTLYASSSNTLAKLTAGAEGTVLKINSGVPVWGSPSATLSVVSKTAAYTAQASDDVIFCNATSAAFQITLPSAGSNSGKFFRIRKTDSTFNAVTVSDGSFTTTLNTQGESIDIVSDGSAWQLYDRVIPSVAGTYTVSITGTTSNPTKGSGAVENAYWYRQRNCLVIQYSYAQTNAGSAGSGNYLFSIPSGLTIDTSKLGTLNGFGASVLGSATGYITTTPFIGYVYPNSSTKLMMDWMNDAFPIATVGSGSLSLSASTWRASFTATIPISGWNV